MISVAHALPAPPRRQEDLPRWASELTISLDIMYGTLARAILAVTGQLVNAVHFGADPSGGTDSGAPIAKALSWSFNNGGGTVLLPPGNYRVDNSITVPDGVILSGVGRGSRLFRGLATGPLLVMQQRSVLERLRVDGGHPGAQSDPDVVVSGSNVTAFSVIFTNTRSSSLSMLSQQHLTVLGCGFFGVGSATDGGGNGVVIGQQVKNVVISGCQFRNYRLAAVRAGGAGMISSCAFRGNGLSTSEPSGQVQLTQDASGWTVASCHFSEGGSASSAVETRGANSRVVGCYVEGGSVGISIASGSGSAVSSNSVTGTTSHGIHVANSVNRFLLVNNMVSSAGGDGMRIEGPSNNIYVILGNVVTGSAGQNIRDLGTGSSKVVANNVAV